MPTNVQKWAHLNRLFYSTNSKTLKAIKGGGGVNFADLCALIEKFGKKLTIQYHQHSANEIFPICKVEIAKLICHMPCLPKEASHLFLRKKAACIFWWNRPQVESKISPKVLSINWRQRHLCTLAVPGQYFNYGHYCTLAVPCLNLPNFGNFLNNSSGITG